MTAPVAVRDVVAAAGMLLVLGTVASVVGTVIVPRKSGSRLTRLVASAVDGTFGLITRPVASYQWRDRIMAGQGAVILLGQLAVWLVSFYVGYALLIWPATTGIGTAFTSVGAALWKVPAEHASPTFISLTHAEFLDAVGRLREVNFPIERAPEAAWPHFVGWRVNYEQATYAITAATDAVPALWSGPRRWPAEPIPPLRPRPGVPFP